MKKQSFIYLFLVMSLIFFSFSPSYASKLSLSVVGSPFQGSILFLTLSGYDEGTSAVAEFDGERAVFVKDGAYMRTSLPITLDASAGRHEIKVIVETPEGRKYFSRSLNVVAHTYGRQNLRLPESQLAKYDNPQADIDNDAIKKALKYNTEGIVWNKNFIIPVKGSVVTLFGLKRFYNDDPEPEFHKGIDIAASTGTKIAASQNGIVRFARRNLVLHGDTVVIDHGRGVGTIYLHMNSVNVKEGQSVRQGDIIGTVGSKGASTGPHLHWAAYSQGEAIDPYQLVKTMPFSWKN